ncbi:type II toxin-antitoxin system PemK/MazF family toxin [Cystobacter fuscus]|uniref:type II toxin-antitoxin system PemK/MazF family toxin n=1 Tax=Cystobacter fuscus TaxID=43 RepID=UPI000971537F|nr:type II toxin-antitoxin system PemK/MazF family toxin [Cystobacter fuscus]
MSTPEPKRGEIWWVNFDPSAGAEIQKTRPALVVSADGLGKLPLRIVVPITDWKPNHANSHWFVEIQPNPSNGLSKASGADAFQVKSVSLRRFRDKVGVVTAAQLEDVAAAIAICVGAP